MYTRYRIPGCPIKETVRRGSGRMLPTVNTVWDGLHMVVGDGGEIHYASRSVVHDGGGMGTGFTFVEEAYENKNSDYQNAVARIR